MFSVGQKVVCINTDSYLNQEDTLPLPLMKGAIYIIRGIRTAVCCGTLLLDVGFVSDGEVQCICGNIGQHDIAYWFLASRFAPLIEKPDTASVTNKDEEEADRAVKKLLETVFEPVPVVAPNTRNSTVQQRRPLWSWADIFKEQMKRQ